MRRHIANAARLAASGALCVAAPAFAFDDAQPVPASDEATLGSAEPGRRAENRTLREFTPDRPDVSESPFTVDAGHIQIETTLFGYTRSRRDAAGVVTDSYEFATSNMRIGVAENLEVQVGWQPYGIVAPRGPTVASRGIGSVTLRAKYNLWGNDGLANPGDTAFALLPYVTLPTDRGNGVGDSEVAFGLIVPLGIELGGGFGLGINAAANFTRKDAREPFDASVLTAASLGFGLTERLGSYAEATWEFSRGGPDGGDVVTLNTGLTFRIAENVQLDAGINVGVTRAADPIAPFIGFAARF